MHFTLSVATNSGQTSNTIYPNQLAITNPQELKQAVQYDHVCGLFKNNQRTIGNFIKADCLVMDCDNDHSDDPAAWINPTRSSPKCWCKLNSANLSFHKLKHTGFF